MIVIHDHCIVIAGKTFAVVGEKIVPAAGGKSSAVHVDHDWALMRRIDLRRPYIHTQAVLAGNQGRAAMQQELIFIGVRQVFAVHIKVRGVQVWTNTAILQRVANSRPPFRFDWRHEAPGASGGGTVGYTFEDVYTVPPKSTDFPCGCFCYGGRVGSDDRAAPANACSALCFLVTFRRGLG